MAEPSRQPPAVTRLAWGDDDEPIYSWSSSEASEPLVSTTSKTRHEVALQDVGLGWRLPQLRLTMYWAVFLFALGARVSDLVYLAWTVAAQVERDDPLHAAWERSTFVASTALTLTVVILDFLARVARLLWRGRRGCEPSCGDWVPAASREFFEETAQGLFNMHDTMSCWTCMGGTLGVFSRGMTAGYNAYDCIFWDSMEDNCQKLHRICGSAGPDTCHLAFYMEGVINSSNSLWALALAATVVGTPFFMWQPVARDAVAKSGCRRLQRLLRLPFASLPPIVLCIASIGHSFTVDYMHPGLKKSDLVFHFWFATAALVFTFLVVLWGGVVAAAYRPIFRMARKSWRWTSRRAVQLSCSRNWLWGCSSNPHRRSQLSTSRMSLAESVKSTTTVYTAELGRRQLQFALLICGALMLNNGFVHRTMPGGWFWPLLVAIWAFRVALLAMMLAARDKPMGFDDLEEATGAGMGLVVYRTDLRRILKALLAGADLSCSEDIPRFKASALRLQDTLAVSYRWHDTRRAIGVTTAVNLSDFQIDALLRATSKVHHPYVWIDVLAVPQDTSGLQETLLSRMMGVYSGAGTVLGIRTLERSESRYHQRAWILQEYCSAKRIIVVDEQQSGGQGEDRSLRGVSPKELRLFHDLRAEVQQEIPRCRPFWLYGGLADTVPEEKVRRFVERYQELSSLVWCQEEADKLRALVPLLANTPVATQAELVELLQQTERRVGVALGQQAARDQLQIL